MFKLFKRKPKNTEQTDSVKPTKNIIHGIPNIHDLFAPDGIDFSQNDYSEIGNKFSKSYAVIGYPANVSVGWLEELLGYNGELDTSIHIWPMDDREALDQLTEQITKAESQLHLEEQKGSNRYITKLGNQIANLYRQRERIELRLERMYFVSILANLYSTKLDTLEKESMLLENRLQSQSIYIRNLKFRQRDCFRSVLPLGENYIEDLYRNFDSGALTASFPFYNADISHDDGVFLGVNLETNSPIIMNFYNRNKLKNGNVNIIAPPGAGKTVFLMAKIMRQVIHGVRHCLIDPEGEYKKFVQWLGGITIPIRVNSPYIINPCDLEEEYDDDGIAFINIDDKVDDILNLIGVMTGGLEMDILSILATIIKDLYLQRGISSDPKSLYREEPVLDPESGAYKHRSIKKDMPTISEIKLALEDRINKLSDKMDVTSLMKKALALNAFCKGQVYGIFDGQTSPELQNFKDNPIVHYDISGLKDGILKSVALFTCWSWMWEKFLKKFPEIEKEGISDEFWMNLKKSFAGSEYTGAFSETISRRSRKRNSSLVTASQSIKEYAESEYGQAIIDNAEVTILLQQSDTTIDDVQALFKLTDGERDFITNCQVGEGLIKTKRESAALNVYLFPEEQEIIEMCNPSKNIDNKGA